MMRADEKIVSPQNLIAEVKEYRGKDEKNLPLFFIKTIAERKNIKIFEKIKYFSKNLLTSSFLCDII